MKVKLVSATDEHIAVIHHLMQFYMYDFSPYTQCDVEANGLFAPYLELESYWDKSNNKFPFIIKTDEKYIGFALVKLIETSGQQYFSIAEFFVLKKYRRAGVGKAVAMQLFSMYKGSWEVYQMAGNTAAQLFWNKVINEFTKGNFKQHFAKGKLIQSFES